MKAKRNPTNKAIKQKQKIVDEILSSRNSLLEDLVIIHDRFNDLADQTSKSAEEWLNALPIQSLKDFDKKLRKSKIDTLRERSQLRKDAEDTCQKIDQIDRDLYIAKIDVLTEKINLALS